MAIIDTPYSLSVMPQHNESESVTDIRSQINDTLKYLQLQMY